MNRRLFSRMLPALPLAVVAKGAEYGTEVSIHGRLISEAKALDTGLKDDSGQPVAVVVMPITSEKIDHNHA